MEGIWGLQERWLVGTEGRGLQRTETRGLGECLEVGVEGRASGDTTAVERQRTEGKDQKKGIGNDQREGIWAL